jgi:hypothetical protein
MPKPALKLENQLRIRLTHETYEFLRAYAEECGVPVGSLCTIVLGQWVRSQKSLAPLTAELGDVLKAALPDLMRQVAEGQIEALPLITDDCAVGVHQSRA